MPELPDVEVYRRYLGSTALHKRIAEVEVHSSRVLEGVSSRRLKDALEGASLEDTSRRGKYLFCELDSGTYLVLHFGMTGFLKYFKNEEQEPSHDRLTLHLENDYRLAYDNQRLLGRVFLADDREEFVREHEIGPDALSVGFDEFASVLRRGRGAVKTSMMNQKMLAGLGNIYTDEILFQARVHPKTRISDLSEEQFRTIYDQMKAVLKEAIDARADPERMPKTYLLPHRDEKDTCPRCGAGVKKITLSGRSAYLCPKCQGNPG
jgi:formamidopyrimidine-DNA glycosylase